jgi:hypothetical protein
VYVYFINRNKQIPKKRGASLARKINFSVCSSSPDSNELDSEQDVFQILFLHAENQTVEAWETNRIIIDDLINHLKAGESVFISPKKHRKPENC